MRAAALPLFIIALSLAFLALGDKATLLLRYERENILAGEIWRLFTANLVHLGWAHTLMNLAGLGLIWALYRTALNPAQWWIVFVTNGFAVSLGLLVLDPRIGWYVGLSGVLHGLFAAGIVQRLREGHKSEWLLLALLAAKLVWEEFFGALPGSAETAGGPVITQAHLYGAIAGAATVFLFAKRAPDAEN